MSPPSSYPMECNTIRCDLACVTIATHQKLAMFLPLPCDTLLYLANLFPPLPSLSMCLRHPVRALSRLCPKPALRPPPPKQDVPQFAPRPARPAVRRRQHRAGALSLCGLGQPFLRTKFVFSRHGEPFGQRVGARVRIAHHEKRCGGARAVLFVHMPPWGGRSVGERLRETPRRGRGLGGGRRLAHAMRLLSSNGTRCVPFHGLTTFAYLTLCVAWHSSFVHLLLHAPALSWTRWKRT